MVFRIKTFKISQKKRFLRIILVINFFMRVEVTYINSLIRWIWIELYTTLSVCFGLAGFLLFFSFIVIDFQKLICCSLLLAWNLNFNKYLFNTLIKKKLNFKVQILAGTLNLENSPGTLTCFLLVKKENL